MFLAGLFRARSQQRLAHEVYTAAVGQARMPEFYAERGVPDTLDGRFEMIALHVFLILHRLRDEPEADDFAQRLFDVFFADMDRSLREMGTGDLTVGKQVKLMASALYGRISSYQAGLAGEASLQEALRRNLFGTVETPALENLDFMDRYLHSQAAALSGQSATDILAGKFAFSGDVT